MDKQLHEELMNKKFNQKDIEDKARWLLADFDSIYSKGNCLRCMSEGPVGYYCKRCMRASDFKFSPSGELVTEDSCKFILLYNKDEIGLISDRVEALLCIRDEDEEKPTPIDPESISNREDYIKCMEVPPVVGELKYRSVMLWKEFNLAISVEEFLKSQMYNHFYRMGTLTRTKEWILDEAMNYWM